MSEEAPKLTPEQEEIERQRQQVEDSADWRAGADNSFIDNVIYDGKDPLPGENRQYESRESIMHGDAQEDDLERTANIADDALRFELYEKGEKDGSTK